MAIVIMVVNLLLNKEVNFQDAVNMLCDYYGISNVTVLIGAQYIETEGADGEYDHIKATIAIDDRNSYRRQVMALLHEFRHHWQFQFYNDLFMWWHNHVETYALCYGNKICAIEEDARIFGYTLGAENGEELMCKYDSDFMDHALSMDDEGHEFMRWVMDIEGPSPYIYMDPDTF